MSEPPVMFSRMPVAPSTEASSSGEEMADAHQRRPGLAHDRAHVGEVEVDQAGHGDEVGDALHALAQNVVGDPERVDDRRALLDHLQQAVVGDDDERVDLVAELADAALGLIGPLAALEPERPRDDPDGERAQLAGDLGDHGRRAGAGAATLARGDEHHVRALQRLLELVAALGRRLEADGRIGPRPQATGDLRANVDLDVGVAHKERLRVGVDRDELDSAQPRVDHAVDRVGAAAADPDHLDDGQIVAARISHRLLPLT
jgi:hypothetical protein